MYRFWSPTAPFLYPTTSTGPHSLAAYALPPQPPPSTSTAPSPHTPSCCLTDLELIGLGGKATSNPAFGEDVMGLQLGPLAGPLGAGLTRLVVARCGVAPLTAGLLEGLTGLQVTAFSCTFL